MIYFFTYGDEKFENTKKRIEIEAKNSGFFDEIKIYNRGDINEDFIKKTEPFIHIRGGYWMWKPLFLKETFDRINHDDYVIYIDAGCTVNPNGKKRLDEYISMLDNDDDQSGMIRFICGPKEELFTNQMVFEHFGKGEDVKFKSNYHLMATVMIFKKTENSIKFVDDYYNLAINHPILFSDHYNEYKKNPDYRGHRNDQSVSSCLVHLNGKCIILEDETYAPDMDGWKNLYYGRKIPFLATRIRN